MSSNKLKLSKLATKEVDHLSARLGLRPNVICRLAIWRSLSLPESVNGYVRAVGEEKEAEMDVDTEFNRYTLTGNEVDVYKILFYQYEYSCV